MATKLIELWITSREGLTYLYASNSTSSNSQMAQFLFSGFLSAVQTMAAESIDAIKMKDSKIIIVPVRTAVTFFVVGRAKAKEKDKNVRKVLYTIMDRFLETYGQFIETWNGEQDIFESFITEMKKDFIQ